MHGRPTTSIVNRPLTTTRKTSGPAPPTAVPVPAAHIFNRPGTQHGLSKLQQQQQQAPGGGQLPLGQLAQQLAGSSSGRLVQDRTYWADTIRQKISYLRSEMDRLAGDVERSRAAGEHQDTANLEKHAELQAEELRDLQGRLGDLNMLVESMHTGGDIDELKRQGSQLRATNEAQLAKLEAAVQLQRRKEASLKDMEQQIEAESRRAEDAFKQMSPEVQSQYQELKRENEAAMQDIQQLQTVSDELQADVQRLEKELSADPSKTKLWQLMSTAAQLQERVSVLENEVAAAQESGPDERERLLRQVKDHNQEISSIERRIAEVEEQIRQTRQRLDEQSEVTAADGEKRAKYNELKQRDDEMTSFLDSFDENMSEARLQTERYESEIKMLLDAIRALDAMTADDAAAAASPKSSKSTQALRQGLEQKARDHAKIQEMAAKVAEETSELREQIQKLQTDLAKIENVRDLKQQADSSKQAMREQAESINEQRRELNDKIRSVEQEAETIRKRLAENDTHVQLTAMEQKVKHLESQNQHMLEAINSRKDASDYDAARAEVMRLMQEYNELLQKTLSGSMTVR